MKYEEAKEVLGRIRSYYPNFLNDADITTKQAWVRQIMKGDHHMTMAKLDDYATKEVFPPKLAHIVYISDIRSEDHMQADIERVEREKADPKLAKEREKKLQKLQRMLKGGVGHE
ncbi:hypothetical protein [Salinicoccus roseus]|uniref:Replicative helicase inhibitor G39P N-terminal domain-containing protein n=1 Tax=Salinicoccus roseus TaxID=45670 RepID=A0A0C2H882_9STAP|nr:hypothetical protein [Salinicoccus roseus]KIH70035.1 hypothetical protein SN16_11055 [Salinicoccus roseus]MDB0581339.1 hypothetical protein [Salinicoccus roseus]